MLLSFKPLPELVQSNLGLSMHNTVQNCSQRFASMLFRIQHFRVQYFVTIIFAPQSRFFGVNMIFDHKTVHELSNLFYFIKLTSISANAFTDAKFKVSHIRSSKNMHFKL